MPLRGRRWPAHPSRFAIQAGAVSPHRIVLNYVAVVKIRRWLQTRSLGDGLEPAVLMFWVRGGGRSTTKLAVYERVAGEGRAEQYASFWSDFMSISVEFPQKYTECLRSDHAESITVIVDPPRPILVARHIPDRAGDYMTECLNHELRDDSS